LRRKIRTIRECGIVFGAAAGETIADGSQREAAMQQIAVLECSPKARWVKAAAAADETMPVGL
jgi:hypothetical protein